MPFVTIDGEQRVHCDDGRRLVLCVEDAGIDILHRCGGNARCTTCRVEILDGDAGQPTEAEEERLSQLKDRPDNLRLSCQVQVHNDLTVRVLRRLHEHPDMEDPGPRPIEWPADHPLPPE